MFVITLFSKRKEPQEFLNFDIWETILEFAGVEDSASIACVNQLARFVALLKYGFINQDMSSGKISYVIDESCFAAGWDFLRHAEYNVNSRLEDNDPLFITERRKFPPKKVELHLFNIHASPNARRSKDLYMPFSKFDELMKVLIPNNQLKQKQFFRHDISSAEFRGFFNEFFQNEKTAEILQAFLVEVREKTGISSTQCWKSTLAWKTYRNDTAIIIKNGALLCVLCIILFYLGLGLFVLSMLVSLMQNSIQRKMFISSIIMMVVGYCGMKKIDTPDFSGLSKFSDKGQYNLSDQWLRFFHNGIAKQESKSGIGVRSKVLTNINRIKDFFSSRRAPVEADNVTLIEVQNQLV